MTTIKDDKTSSDVVVDDETIFPNLHQWRVSEYVPFPRLEPASHQIGFVAAVGRQASNQAGKVETKKHESFTTGNRL